MGASKLIWLFLLFLMVPAVSGQTGSPVISVDLPDHPVVNLVPFAKLGHPGLTEASGLVKSRFWKDVFWTHNDSGDEARIFPIRRDGSVIKPEWSRDYQGIFIPDAVNADWETIAVDDKGMLYIGDTGNNGNMRRDLTIYAVPEPYPQETIKTGVLYRFSYFYPDQQNFPPQKMNFDGEALFWARDHLYILTKHRSDEHTKLYRLDKTKPFERNPATFIAEFDIKGMVSGADASPDGNRVVVLTQNAVWQFQRPEDSDNYFAGIISWLPVSAKQCEAICYDDEEIIILNEEGELYKLNVSQLINLN